MGKFRRRGESIHEGTMTLAGWSDAAYGDQSALGECPLGYVIGLMSSALRAPHHIIQRTPKYTRKLVGSSLRVGEVHAFSETVDHMSMFRGFYVHFMDLSPGVVGFEDCERPFTPLKD